MTHYAHDLRDGRKLGITGLGDPDATRLVLFCHPGPGVGGFDPDPAVTATRGVRIVAPDRPGYGASDPKVEEGAPVGLWLQDLDDYLTSVESSARAVSDVNFGRIGVIGWGIGALYAAALAGRYPQLVEALALVEPTAPTPARLDSAGAVDSRLESRASLARASDHPGADHRLGFMIEEAASSGEAGLAFDRQALADSSWHDSLRSIQAPTLIVSTGKTDDARWYRHRIHSVRQSTKWTDPSTTIVEAWPEILNFMQPRISQIETEITDLVGSSPQPAPLIRRRLR